MAALGLVPGEALLGTVGHHATSPGMSLPDFTLSCTHSFPGETQVLMADGTTKAIKDVKVGDRVANAQPDGRTEIHRVDEVHVTSTDTEFADLTVTTPQGERTITSTQNHPYWDATARQFVTAANLRPGHELQTDGGTATVGAVHNYTTTTVTYDLTVNGVHTYYVVAGTTPVLVHNCGEIALGKSEIDGDPMALQDFADSRGAKSYHDWPSGGDNWVTEFKDYVKDGETTIHFSLNGIEDPVAFASRGRGLDPILDGYATAWELAFIQDNPESWSRVKFYRDGSPVDNPFNP